MKLIFLTYILICMQLVSARIHQLKLEDDNREQITISTYGFLKNGILQVDIKKLEYNPIFKLDSIRNSFAFILEKTKNNGFSSFSTNNEKEDYCALIRKRANNKNKERSSYEMDMVPKTRPVKKDRSFLNNFAFNKGGEHSYSLIVFHLDLIKKNVDLIRIGPDLKNLRINSNLVGKNGYGLKQLKLKTSESAILNKTQTISRVQNRTDIEKKGDMDEDNYDPNFFLSDKFDNSAVINEFIEDRGQLKTIDFNITNSSLSFKFEMNVKSSDEEGLYIFSFFNCLQPSKKDLILNKFKSIKKEDDKSIFDDQSYFFEYDNSKKIKFGVNLEIDLLERNEDSFLSAGELPMPTLYLTWSIIYFLAGISWVYILKTSKGEVFKIHYLMTALVFVKSISLTFHAINMHYIAVNGMQEAIWAILFYITYFLRGLLLIISILLVGTGFTIIKHILSESERRLFLVVIPLQMLAIIAYIFLEEKEQGNADYVTWRQIFFVLDLFCCGAILFPVVWSIRHLESASRTDGKMIFNLKKLQIFKHFYIMIIFYIYFTRIVGFLLKQMLPFRYEWAEELSMELFTFTFFTLTAFKFQPASNNAYLRVGDDMDEIHELLHQNETVLDVDTETVLDLIEQDYYVSGLTSSDDSQLQPSGPESKNPTLQNRGNMFTNDEYK